MSSTEATTMESLEQVQARHRKEQRDLQSRITNKKKNATKKTRKFVNDECAELDRQLKERQEGELRQLAGGADGEDAVDGNDEGDKPQNSSSQQPTSSPSSTDALAATLQTTTLSSSSSQPQPPSQQQQEPPKPKRNRQKERLARRAAEQEAAAAAAETEAASMTDHRGAERTHMQAAFAARALREHEIAPDGHCLFSAVADQLASHGISIQVQQQKEGGAGGDGKEGAGKGEQPYRAVRRAAAAWISQHRDEYAGFLEEGVDEYVSKIRDTAEWGGQLELSALANAYGVEIRVVQGGDRVEVVRPNAAMGGEDGAEEKKEEGEEAVDKTLWLAYYRHGYGLGEHYNSLRKAG